MGKPSADTRERNKCTLECIIVASVCGFDALGPSAWPLHSSGIGILRFRQTFLLRPVDKYRPSQSRVAEVPHVVRFRAQSRVICPQACQVLAFHGPSTLSMDKNVICGPHRLLFLVGTSVLNGKIAYLIRFIRGTHSKRKEKALWR